MSDVHPATPDKEGMVDEEVGVEEAPLETTTATESKTMVDVAGHDISETQLAVFITFVASIVLLIATGVTYDWSTGSYTAYQAYAMSISSVTLGLSGIHLLMSKFTEDLHTKFGKHMCSLMFVWSFIGACFLTFDKPFVYTGNGYFSAWATVFGSAMAMGVNAEALGSKLKGLGSVMSLLASSVVVFLASAAPIRDNDPNKSEAFYACILAVVTFVVLGLVVLMDNRGKALPPKLYFGMMAIFSCCWIVMAFLVTFRGPFDVTGNGYFGSWVGALACSFATFAAKKAL